MFCRIINGPTLRVSLTVATEPSISNAAATVASAGTGVLPDEIYIPYAIFSVFTSALIADSSITHLVKPIEAITMALRANTIATTPRTSSNV